MKWRATIAGPLLAHPEQQLLEMDKRNKLLSDYETKTVQQIRQALADTNAELAKTTQTELDRSSYARAFWLLVFGLLAILINGFRSRLYQELEEEKSTTEILQRAFRSESVPLPNCQVGSAYLSAGSHLAVGGDVFDVYRLSNTLALVLIADVSGKGVDAAVLTAFIKFTIRGIALRRRDPGAILAEFNTAFSQTVENPYLFVSMFVGVLDTETFQLRYASAGHDSAFMRRSKDVQQLAVTGPVLGVMEEPFGTKAIVMEDGDTLVLATDGLTEARKRTGEQLRETGAMELIEDASVDPQHLADELVAQVRALGGNHLRDDLAILAIRVIVPKEPHA
jgi:sigma-B regulation protein RsbU (phosphoserine phosphatase)